MNQLETIHKEWLMKTWDDYPPEWFITFRYRNQPKTIEEIEGQRSSTDISYLKPRTNLKKYILE